MKEELLAWIKTRGDEVAASLLVDAIAIVQGLPRTELASIETSENTGYLNALTDLRDKIKSLTDETPV